MNEGTHTSYNMDHTLMPNKESLLHGYQPRAQSSFLNPVYMSQFYSNSSFDELKLEDDVDDMYSKWTVCKDIVDNFYSVSDAKALGNATYNQEIEP